MLHISPNEFDFQLIPNIQSLLSLGQQSFDARLHHADEGSVRGHTCYNGVEHGANAMLHGGSGQATRNRDISVWPSKTTRTRPRLIGVLPIS